MGRTDQATQNPKIIALNSKPDFASVVSRAPASTKNNINKKQLDGQVISKKTIAESLASQSVVAQTSAHPVGGGQLSVKVGAGTAAGSLGLAGFGGDAHLLMQAVNSQIHTPHAQQKMIEPHGGGSAGLGTTSLHRRKASVNNGAPAGSTLGKTFDQNALLQELKR